MARLVGGERAVMEERRGKKRDKSKRMINFSKKYTLWIYINSGVANTVRDEGLITMSCGDICIMEIASGELGRL